MEIRKPPIPLFINHSDPGLLSSCLTLDLLLALSEGRPEARKRPRN